MATAVDSLHHAAVDAGQLQAPEVVFRQGIEQLIAADDVAAAARLMFNDCVEAMHTGQLAEFAQAWMVDDVQCVSQGLPYLLDASGQDEWLLRYNEMIVGYYGAPEATIVFEVNAAIRTGHRRARVYWTNEVVRSPKGAFVERRMCDPLFDESFRVLRLLCSSPEMGLDGLTAPAAIRPVEVKPTRVANPRRSTHKEPPASAPAQPPCTSRPCLHNCWDSVRMKKGVALLRCRTCVAQWKVPISEVHRCKKFLEDPALCRLGTLCPNLHVHARKKTYEDRMAAVAV